MTFNSSGESGFNQFFDDIDATKSWRYGAGLDWRLTKALFAGAELTWRDLDEPIRSESSFENRDEQLYRGYLYWTPFTEVALSTEIIYDAYDAEEGIPTEFGDLPEKLETISVPVTVRYFHPKGFLASAGVTYVNQQVRRSDAAPFADGSDDFMVVDAMVGYRFPKRFGIASVEVTNLFDTTFKYQDDSFREFRDDPAITRYIPERTIMGRITINF